MALGKMTTICGSDRVTARTRAHTRTRTHARAFFDFALTPGHGIGEPADARVPWETCYAVSGEENPSFAFRLRRDCPSLADVENSYAVRYLTTVPTLPTAQRLWKAWKPWKARRF